MPHKHNADRLHHLPKMSFKVQNWAAYEAGLRRRGSLTLLIKDEVLENRQSCGRNGQCRYSALAIQTSLMLRTALRMALRQAEGLLGFVMTQMNLKLSAPDNTTVNCRAVTLPALPREVSAGPLDILSDSTDLQVLGAGQWLEEKHGAKSRLSWRKLHLAVDAQTGMAVSHTLTEQHAGDPSQVSLLLDQIDGEIAWEVADGAHDGTHASMTMTQLEN